MRVDVDNGKYTVVNEDSGRMFTALRNDEDWRDLTGDNLVYHLAVELHAARAKIRIACECLNYNKAEYASKAILNTLEILEADGSNM